MTRMTQSVERQRRRYSAAAGWAEDEPDPVAREEPLEIRVCGDPMAVTMRTPGADRELVLGFLLAEGVIRERDDVGTIARCGRPGEEGYGNVVDVLPGARGVLDFDGERARRGTLISAACGVCGRRTIADLLARGGALPKGERLAPELLGRAQELLAAHQPLFQRTGGVHGAAAVDAGGALCAAAEDIGRHNAVDKVVGALLLRGELARARVLAVSGRASFEMVQKAVAARIPVLVSVSAASSLAIDLAEAAGLTLASFARGGAMSLYTHRDRIALAPPIAAPI